MATVIISKTSCDNYKNCGQSIEHVIKWPPGWGHMSLVIRDQGGYVSSRLIDLDLCPICLHAGRRAILEALERIQDEN